MAIEAWLRGPLPDVAPELMPAAHALTQVREDLPAAARGLTPAELWVSPGGAAPVGFHLKHLAGATGRLLAYAAGRVLTPEELAAIPGEKQPGDPPADAALLLSAADAALARALETIRATPRSEWFAPRAVGRQKLPTTVLGLLCHVAEHAQRHTGQVITTSKIVRGLGLAR